MAKDNHEPLFIGKIQYTNAWPVFHHFHPEQLRTSAELVTEVPAVLNRRITEGLLDMSAMSSFAYASAAEHLLILPQLSVSVDGAVKSILLFSRKPLEEIRNGRIALTNTSATSINLLKILMTKYLGGKPEYFDCEPDLDTMMRQADAALLIGDHAIRASWANENYVVTDLGALWKEWTGHSMTFAVWAVRREVAEHRPEAVAEIVEAFHVSKRQSLENLTPVIEQAMTDIGGTETYWKQYFTNLCYDFGKREQGGLELYLRYAHEMGLLAQEINLELWNDNMLIRVKE